MGYGKQRREKVGGIEIRRKNATIRNTFGGLWKATFYSLPGDIFLHYFDIKSEQSKIWKIIDMRKISGDNVWTRSKLS